MRKRPQHCVRPADRDANAYVTANTFCTGYFYIIKDYEAKRTVNGVRVMLSSSSINMIKETAVPFRMAAEAAEHVLAIAGDAQFVLIGEASHGTHEFYKCRAEATLKLIEKKGFSAVAVEADFPDAYRVNRYLRGGGKDKTAEESLGDFQRFPLWMWRNTEVLDFIDRLKQYNDSLDPNKRVGFYGIDLYSLHASIDAVLGYLDKTDQEASKRARYRYSCFEDYGEDAQSYGYAASFSVTKSCEDEVVNQLVDLQREAYHI